MAGLKVGQAFGVFLLLGLEVSSSSPHVLRHPTSMCDSGVNNTGTMDVNTKKGINTPYYKNLIIIVICTYQKQCHVLQCYVMLRLLSVNNEE